MTNPGCGKLSNLLTITPNDSKASHEEPKMAKICGLQTGPESGTPPYRQGLRLTKYSTVKQGEYQMQSVKDARINEKHGS